MAQHPNSLANLKPAWTANAQPKTPGRNAGQRDKISKRLLHLLAEDFEKHGAQAVVDWREQHLDKYMSALMGLLPKEATLNINTSTPLDDLSTEQLAALAAGLAVLAEQSGQGEAGAGEEAGSGELSPLH